MTTPTHPDVSVVIVSWNVRRLLEANLQRLQELPDRVTREVFVVDNGSHDGTAEMVRTRFPWVKLITNDWDAGFAGPNNQALRLAQGDVCILLNPDMLVEPGALDHVHKRLTNEKDLGVLGVQLRGIDGKPIKGSVRRLPDIRSQLVILLKLQHLFPQLLDHYLWNDFDFSRSQDVPQVRGSFFAFRRELLSTIGYLDDRYHIWFEEVDYCLRVQQAGMRVAYDATVFAQDYVGKGVSQMKRLETQWIFGNSMTRYFWKWKPLWQLALVLLARPIGLLAAILADLWASLRKPSPSYL